MSTHMFANIPVSISYVAPRWKQPTCPTMDNYLMVQQLSNKKEKNNIYNMNLKNITLSKIRQTPKPYAFIYMKLQKRQRVITENKLGIAWAQTLGKGINSKGTQRNFQGDTTVDIVIMVELTQHYILVRFSRLQLMMN